MHASAEALAARSLDDLPVPIWVGDANAVPLYRNAAWYRYTGRRPTADVAGEGALAMHPDDVLRCSERHREMVATGRAAEAEVRYRRFDSTFRWFQVRAEPLHDADGNVYGWIGVCCDVDELRKTMDAFAALTRTLPNHIWIARADGWVDWVNERYASYSGRAAAELLGRAGAALIHPADRGDVDAAWERGLQDGEAFVTRQRVRGADGVYRWFQTHVVPLRDGGEHVFRWFATSSEIDAHMRERQQLSALIESMPQLAWIAGVDGRIEFWNTWIRAYTGLDVQTGDDAFWRLIVHPDDLESATMPWFGRARDGAGPAECEVRLRRSDGAYRWFLLRAAPFYGADGAIERWFGTGIDIEDRRREELAMRFLADCGSLLAATSDLDAKLLRVAHRATPEIARSCGIFVDDGAGAVRCVAFETGDVHESAALLELHRRYPLKETDPRRVAMATQRPILDARVEREQLLAIAHDDAHLAYLERIGLRSAVVVPLIAAGRTVGVMQFANYAGDRRLDERDLRIAETLAERVAVAIDNQRIHERDRRASLSFQHAALPRALPQIPGIELRAVYASAESGAEVGGDWYDAFVLPQGTLALSIGDVAGRGVDAAVIMSAMRQAIRVAMLQGLDPSRALRAADLALRSEDADRLVTALVVRLDPERGTLTYAVAGHPAPVVRTMSGSVRLLPADPAPPLGIAAPIKAPTHHDRLDPGDLLVLYTDGLIESTRDPVEGERQLLAVLGDEAFGHTADPATLVSDAALRGRVVDDVALLTLRVSSARRWSFATRDAMAAQGARSTFRRHLEAYADPASDLAGAELIFGELVGNVVRYAPGPLDVALDWSERAPVLHVVDRGPGYTVKGTLPPDAWAENGRGLYLCAALGSAFEVRRHAAAGSHVRVTLPVTAR